ncbi:MULTISPECIES: sensor histidine kinase [Faecalicatena]|nr:MULTISPECIES: GHKL domain-containing protein [Faecalicatena]MCI6465075.1 GHKL domain-containing protein [Faecalicatena sp.]MDY5617094.1 GHKL domain-containing protein [Lachnospiraceae bacterium]
MYQLSFMRAQVSMVFMQIFIWYFVPTNLRLSRRIIIMAEIYVGCIFLDYMQYFVVKQDITQILQAFFGAVIVQGSLYRLCKYKDFRALFSGLTTAVVLIVGDTLGMIAFLATKSIIVSLASQILVHSLVILILVHFCRENWLWLLEGKWKFWGVLCLIPFLFWLVTYALTIWPQSVWNGDNYRNLLGVMILLILLETSYFIILAGVAHQFKMGEIEQENAYLETYASRLKNEAERLREHEAETAVFRHDLRHYFRQIQSYAAEGDIEEINKVMGQLDQKVLEITPKRYCDNLAVNGVITHCNTVAEREGVSLTIETEVPRKISINEFEFATVVSNLLENAVQAAAKVPNPDRRRAAISMHGVKGKLMLEISNSYVGDLEISPDTGVPVSKEEKGHGYGVKSVLAFARKNHAIFDYEVEKETVSVRLLV